MTGRRLRRAAAAIAVLAVTAAAPAQCGSRPSGNPFGACPPGQHRVRDVTRPPGQQWVCAR